MTNRICTFDGCDRKHSARGLCSVHYNQLRRGKGLSPAETRGRRTKPHRVAGYDSSNGIESCWPWLGTIDAHGYGVVMRNGVMHKAHRYVWEESNGKIPPGLVLDHKCFTKACVNPSHLRAITQKQNSEHLQGATKASTTGVRNVFKRGDKFVAQVRHNRKLHHAGTFATIEDATIAAENTRRLLFTHAD